MLIFFGTLDMCREEDKTLPNRFRMVILISSIIH